MVKGRGGKGQAKSGAQGDSHPRLGGGNRGRGRVVGWWSRGYNRQNFSADVPSDYMIPWPKGNHYHTKASNVTQGDNTRNWAI